jgi:serine/threonine protein kinase
MDAGDWPDRVKWYHLMDEIGHGSFSRLCKAVNTKMNRVYACKVFAKDNLANGGDTERFQREINAMAFLKHDNIVSLHDFFWDECNFYLILDFCPGGELFDYIVEHDRLDEPIAALVFRQILSAVAYYHSYGVTHRDLKPENVLIVDFPHIKVADFGLCGFISDGQMMRTFCRSPCYCSPECLCRVEYDGRKSDVWSLGVILFAMVTAEHPWNVTNSWVMLRQVLKGIYTIPSFVSAECSQLITGMMMVSPAERMTLDADLRHPWLRRAEPVMGRLPVGPSRLVMPEQPVSLRELSEACARSSQQSDSGIYTPFEERGDGNNGDGEMPKLFLRSQSQKTIADGSQLQALASQKKRMQGGRLSGQISIAGARQRSATNVAFLKGRLPARRKDMGVIREDGDS